MLDLCSFGYLYIFNVTSICYLFLELSSFWQTVDPLDENLVSDQNYRLIRLIIHRFRSFRFCARDDWIGKQLAFLRKVKVPRAPTLDLDDKINDTFSLSKRHQRFPLVWDTRWNTRELTSGPSTCSPRSEGRRGCGLSGFRNDRRHRWSIRRRNICRRY